MASKTQDKPESVDEQVRREKEEAQRLIDEQDFGTESHPAADKAREQYEGTKDD